jgi:Pentapeptide repeats (8 copies)
MPKRFALAVLGLLLVTAAWAQEAQKPVPCPHPDFWKPTEEQLQQVLSAWDDSVEPENLCNAHLPYKDFRNAQLGGVILDGAFLISADLSKANLLVAKLNRANLTAAALNNADLTAAQLNGANLLGAQLNGAILKGAHLSNADLYGARLNGADLSAADLNGAKLAGADLTAAMYAPASAPPDPYVAGITGLSTVRFPPGEETGLVQLRDLLQKAGLRDLEREATFAIERGKTRHSLAAWKENPAGAAEGIFRYVAFDLTTAYGMRPSRALLVIAAVWLLTIPIYAWPLWQMKRPPTAGSIYRIWPKDRVGVQEHKPTLDIQERLHRRGLAAIGWSAYFSLLSAFQVGYREFSIGSWLSRAQPRDFTLASTGWVRTVSGIQSLLSVYLLALWVLTYFGRPFQ